MATSLCEIASASNLGLEANANSIPVREEVKRACEILGLDPLFVANEGKLVAMVAESRADAVLAAIRRVPEGRESVVIGRVVREHPALALLKTEIG
jgi:hydrogenase expression/formation protein HypE